MYLKLLLFVLVSSTVMGGLLFGAAGRWNLPFFWTYIVVFQAVGTTGWLRVLRTTPDLMQERFRPGPGGKDPVTRPAAIPLAIIHWVLAGLDAGRFHWSPEISLAVQGVALGLVGAGLGVWMWAMTVNPFFSSAVRIQRDRGHHVIRAGPYRAVRHPGYLAGIVLFLASPLALGSLWAALPAFLLAVLFLRRTRLEDRVLARELEGYTEYAQQVRYRLVPRVW